MSEDPLYIRILEKLGVNTTRLRWKLYQKEQQIKDIQRTGIKPKGLQWLSYPHKICAHCHAINDRESKICSSCNRRLPNMLLYKITRFLTTAGPTNAPITIQSFLGLMFLFFAVQVSLGGFQLSNIMSPNFTATTIMGAFTPDIFTSPFHAFRWLAFGLLHGGLIHIAFNSYALYNIGPLIESQITRARMLTLITLSQLGAAFACYLWYYKIQQVGTPVVGASGWLFGLIGFGIVTFHRMGIPSIRDQLIKWTVIVLVFGLLMPGISNSGHIGGLVAGAATALLPQGDNLRQPWVNKAWTIAAIVSLLLWAATIVAMFISMAVLAPRYL